MTICGALVDGWDFAKEHLGEWEAWVAIGTLALAASTWRLARETRSLSKFTAREVAAAERQANAAYEQLQVARASLESSIRPVALDVPEDGSSSNELVTYDAAFSASVNRTHVHVATDRGYLHISVPFRNAGIGIAFVDRCSIRTADRFWEGTTTVQALPPGEVARMRFSVPNRVASYAAIHEGVVESGQLTVEIVYSDASARQQPITRLVYARRDDQGWGLDRVIVLGVWSR